MTMLRDHHTSVGPREDRTRDWAQDYRAPRWLPGGHAQTIWPALWARTRSAGSAVPVYMRERWDTPDGDFIDVDFLQGSAQDQLAVQQPRKGCDAPGAPDAPTGAGAGRTSGAMHTPEAPRTRPTLVLFHGLEGSSQGTYALAFADIAARRGWHYAVPHFRGCSGELNRAPRAYHSGDFEEIDWILRRLRTRTAGPLMAVGISLGGNALMRWAAEQGDAASAVVRSVASVCSPLDLTASGNCIDRGFNREVYARMFLRTMKPRALAKWAQHPGLFDRQRLMAARTLREFDEVFTGPLHGFEGTDDYWHRASAKPQLHRIRVPALALNARNDPFIPASSLPERAAVGPFVELWQPAHGGHVGFPAGAPPGHVLVMPESVADWLAEA